jgi:aldehyde:ferredoxin oxidoreductase
MVDSINAAAGWDLDIQDALKIGERATNMARVFNAREGFSRVDDTLPQRLFEGLENGALQGKSIPKDEFKKALDVLYKIKGWNPETGNPTPEKLRELSLDWAVEMLPESSA